MELLGFWAKWRYLKVTQPLRSVILTLVLSVFLLPEPNAAQTPVPPNLNWQTFQTPHLDVVFAPGLDELARHAAERGEAALATLRARGFGMLPRERIQLVISDHMDTVLGSASVIPYPRIVVAPHPPVHGLQAMPFEDWLDFVLLHEMVHILHLEMTGPLGRAARSVFGRVPAAFPFFPAFALPSWALEGVAVHGETEHTGAGRLFGTRFHSVLYARALLDTPDRLDQAMGQSPKFPGGERPYVGGGAFFHHLAAESGTDAVDLFFHRQATRLNPFRLNASAVDAFGITLSEAHARWVEGVMQDAQALVAGVEARAVERERAGIPPLPTPQFWTRGARIAVHPILSHSDDTLFWIQQDGGTHLQVLSHPWPARTGSMGTRTLQATPVGPRLHAVSPLSLDPEGALWTAQLEARDRASIRAELWRIEPTEPSRGRSPRAYARNARITQADVHPGHGRMVGVADIPGTNMLALVRAVGGPENLEPELLPLLPPALDVHWTAPRWSPDGTRIAAVRWNRGGEWSVGVLDPEEAMFHPVASGRAPIHGVTWTEDGAHLIWSWEASGVANLYGAPATPAPQAVAQITDLPQAAHAPAVIGGHLFFSLLGADGWDLVHIPLDPDAWFEPLPPDPRFGRLPLSNQTESAGWTTPEAGAPLESRPWSPWSTLRPRHWVPRIQTAVHEGDARVLAPAAGLWSWGRDAVGRHAWEATVDLPLSGPAMRWEGRAEWAWAGLGDPVVTTRASRTWTSLGAIQPPAPPSVDGSAPGSASGSSSGPTAEPPLLYLAVREQSMGASVAFLRPGLSQATGFSLGVRRLRESLELLEPGGDLTERARLARPVRNLVEGSVAVGWSSVRSTPMAPGPQSGTALNLRLRSRMEPGLPDGLKGRPGVGGDARRHDLLLSARHKMPLPAPSPQGDGVPPVLAFRGAMGLARGPGATPMTWALGGGSGDATRRLGVTWDRLPGAFQVRGWPEGALRGEQVWGSGAELRVPVALLHRGAGVLPLYLDRLALGGWVDAAGQLSPTAVGAPHRFIAATGVEAVLLHGVLTWQPDILRLGFALPVQGGDGVRRPEASFYAALGWSF